MEQDETAYNFKKAIFFSFKFTSLPKAVNVQRWFSEMFIYTGLKARMICYLILLIVHFLKQYNVNLMIEILELLFPVIVTEVTINLCKKEFLFSNICIQFLLLDGYYHTLRRCMVANIFAIMNSFFSLPRYGYYRHRISIYVKMKKCYKFIMESSLVFYTTKNLLIIGPHWFYKNRGWGYQDAL